MATETRRDLAILSFVTLDGIMQAPAQPEEDRSGGFRHGGWAAPYWDEVMAQVKEEAMAAPYDLLLGRKTYEIFAPHFSKVGDKDADAAILNNATKYVATNTLTDLHWPNSVALAGDTIEAIKRLKTQDGPLLQVHGSWQLIQALLAYDLIDEMRLWTFPVIVGGGKRLFGDGDVRRDFELKKSAATKNGVIMTIYRRQNAQPIAT